MTFHVAELLWFLALIGACGLAGFVGTIIGGSIRWLFTQTRKADQ